MEKLRVYENMGHDIYNDGDLLRNLAKEQADSYDAIDRNLLNVAKESQADESLYNLLSSALGKEELDDLEGSSFAYENNRVKPMSAYPNTYF